LRNDGGFTTNALEDPKNYNETLFNHLLNAMWLLGYSGWLLSCSCWPKTRRYI